MSKEEFANSWERSRSHEKIKLDDREEQQQQQWEMSDDGSCLELRWQTQLRKNVRRLLFSLTHFGENYSNSLWDACCSENFFWKLCDNLRNVIKLIRNKKSAVDEWFNDMKWETQWNNEHSTIHTISVFTLHTPIIFRITEIPFSEIWISETFYQLHATHTIYPYG